MGGRGGGCTAEQWDREELSVYRVVCAVGSTFHSRTPVAVPAAKRVLQWGLGESGEGRGGVGGWEREEKRGEEGGVDGHGVGRRGGGEGKRRG